jgi:16S rRNA (uracil1498-N3)-methyltransferase
MTRRRWIADEFSSGRAALTGAHAAHLARTLRARVGQEFEVACGETVHRATVASVADDRVEFALGEEISASGVVPVTLLLAVFKFDRMEWAIEKCTELNVTTIVPVIARRTEKHLAQAAEKRVERWRRIAREASEQSRRTTPPEIAAPMKLKDVLAQGTPTHNAIVIPTEGLSPSGGTCGSPEAELRLVLAETERDIMLTDVLRAQTDIRSLTLAIGPEGGWTPEELRDFATARFIPCSLGDTILRAETAAIAAVAIARAEI